MKNAHGASSDSAAPGDPFLVLERTRQLQLEESFFNIPSPRYHIWYDASMAWTVETLNETVDAELAELPADMRARLVRISELIESVGLPNVKEPHVRHIRGQLWEIRLKGKAGIARALYVTAKEQRVVILRAFIKKTEKTPTGEIDLALQRAKELKP